MPSAESNDDRGEKDILEQLVDDAKIAKLQTYITETLKIYMNYETAKKLHEAMNPS